MKKLLSACFCLISSFVFSITVQDISIPDYDLSFAEIAMNDSGQAIAVWENYHTYNKKSKVEYATSLDCGNSWNKQETLVRYNNHNDELSPNVIINNKGDILCLWKEKDSYLKIAKSFDFGKTWEFDESINDEHVWNYSITNIDNEIILVVTKTIQNTNWRDKEKFQIEVYQSKDFGDTWVSRELFKTESIPLPEIKMKSSGQAIITFKDEKFENYNTNYFLFSLVSKNFGENWIIYDGIKLKGYLDEFNNDIDDFGNGVVVWISKPRFYDQKSIKCSFMSDADTKWSEPKFIDNYDDNWLSYIKVSLDSNKRIFVVWSENSGEYDKGDYIKFVMSDDLGNIWSKSEIISDITTDCENPLMFSDSKGHLLIVWSAQNDKEQHISMQYRFSQDFGNTWSQIYDLSNRSIAWLNYPKIMVNNNGNALALWVKNEKDRDKCQVATSSDYGQTWK